MKFLPWVCSTLQCEATSIVAIKHCEVAQKIQLFFFYQVIFRAGQFTYPTVIRLTAGHCVQTIVWFVWFVQAEDKQLPSLALPSSPSCWDFTELLSLPSASWKHQPSQGKESAVCKQKALGRSHSAAVWEYWRSLAAGNNVYLMVSTICIYINSNEYLSHIHAQW